MLISNNRYSLNSFLWGSTVDYPSDSLASRFTLYSRCWCAIFGIL